MKSKVVQYTKEGINFIEIKTVSLKVTLCDFGASIYSIYFDNTLMTQTTACEKDFFNSDIYHGKTIGRTGNRIAGNTISIDDVKYKILNNEKNNVLHGGIDGLSTKFFNYRITENEDSVTVIFNYLSKDGDSGFPGNLNVIITYVIENGNINCFFEAHSDKNTLCNLTNHTFFTMGEKSLSNCFFKINASNYLFASEDELLPIERREVFSELDFREFKCITDDVNSPKIKIGKANGYDHNFYLDKIDIENPQIFMRSRKYLLSITTDFECCQIYSDNYKTKYHWIDLDDGIRRSLAIEPQDDFLSRKILKPNEIYSRFIKYLFEKI